MVVQQEGGAVQPHGCLPGSGTTLDGQELFEGGTDDLILLGLDRRDDVEHFTGARPFELGQQCVAASQPSRAGLVVSPVEEVVGNGDHRPSIDHDLAPAHKPEWLSGTGSVERHRNRSSPIDDDGVGLLVLHVAAADMPGATHSSSIRPKRSGRGLSARSATRLESAAT